VSYLEVDVFQPPHNDTVQRVLWQFQACILLEALNVDESTHKLSVQQGLVGQSLDVLGCVGVNVLQRAGKLVVKPLDKGHNAARNAEDGALLDRG
jgi:hypothetical protein